MKALILLASALNLAGQVGLRPSPVSPVEAQAQMTGKASIEGTVVDSLTGQPVRKATVALTGRIGLINAVTDTSGHFAFHLLPAGQYTIRVSNENYPLSRPLQAARAQVLITLKEDEQKQDVSLALVPGASVSGRIADEEDNPMQGCLVSAMQVRNTDFGTNFPTMGSGQSDNKGEYRVTKLAPGKYYIEARCGQGVPLPHAFVLRTASSDLPSLVYPLRFYPGVADFTAATKVDASPGANVSGISFKMSPATGFTIRGHVAPVPNGGNIQIMLQPSDPAGRQSRQGAGVNGPPGEFQIRNVLPGSYVLVASGSIEGRSYFARVPVEVGATKPDPVDLALAEVPSVGGTISIEGDNNAAIKGLKLNLSPLDQQPMGPPPQADVQSDGTFSFNSVVPGHWRLFVNGVAYLKSVTRGDQQVSANDLEIGASGISLKIVLGAKFGQIDATVSDPISSTEPTFGILWSAGEPRFIQNFALDRQPHQVVGLPPGKYYGCAIATGQPAMMLQDYAVRKALESRCAAVELPEGEHASMQMPLISKTDLEQLMEKLDQ
jgi:hypothetical protein